jgi:3-oxoacyl-[acyl-carrier-protein] synthase II
MEEMGASRHADDIVVTGVGAVTPLGIGTERLFERWLAGENRIRDGFATCDEFDPGEHLSRREVRTSDRFTHLTIVAAQEALRQAGWEDGGPYPSDRVGTVVSSGVGGQITLDEQSDAFRSGRNVSPHTVTRYMINAAAATLAIRNGWTGESHAVVAACASGVQAIGSGLRLLRCDEVDAVVVGGSDTYLTPFGKSSFALMGALSRSGRCRPYDRRRDGFTPGEGAGVMVLERRTAAAARGARSLAYIGSVAATNDAHHLALPATDAGGLALAIKLALERSGLEPRHIDHVNPHGASSEAGDRAETIALKEALGTEAHRIPISSTKSAIGHLIGAAGVVETITAVLALRQGKAPATLGLEEPDDDLDLWYVVDQPVEIVDRADKGFLAALSFSFGLGGHNAAAVVCVGQDEVRDAAH